MQSRYEVGSVEAEILGSTQKALCQAYVSAYRIAAFEHRKFKLAGGFATIDESQRLSALTRFEEDGLLSALGRLRRWITLARRRSLLPKAFGAAFQGIEKDARAVRNMREHYEDYLVGKGANQADFVRTLTLKSGDQVRVSAGWTVHDTGEHLIGGRLALMRVLEALKALLEEFRRLDLWALPWSPADLLKQLVEYVPPDEVEASG